MQFTHLLLEDLTEADVKEFRKELRKRFKKHLPNVSFKTKSVPSSERTGDYEYDYGKDFIIIYNTGDNFQQIEKEIDDKILQPMLNEYWCSNGIWEVNTIGNNKSTFYKILNVL